MHVNEPFIDRFREKGRDPCLPAPQPSAQLSLGNTLLSLKCKNGEDNPLQRLWGSLFSHQPTTSSRFVSRVSICPPGTVIRSV